MDDDTRDDILKNDYRRICDEDDDLSEVTVETVPDEVREWLAATFTRQAGKRRKEIKFKSVANAIRTGIMFEKMFRKTTSVIAPIPADLQLIIKVRILKRDILCEYLLYTMTMTQCSESGRLRPRSISAERRVRRSRIEVCRV